MDIKKNVNLTSEISESIDSMQNKLDILKKYISKNNFADKIDELKKKSEDPDLWQDQAVAAAVLREYSGKKRFIDNFNQNNIDFNNLKEMFEEYNTDDSMIQQLHQESLKISESIDRIYLSTLFSDKYDDFPCFITVTAGSGGLEAQDWASILFNMYYHFAKNSEEYKQEVIEYTDKDVGIKSATLKVTGGEGSFAYGMLKGENGVHRLVRPSPFNSNNNRHTSFASVMVTPLIEETVDINIAESDLRIDTYRASGAGGQHVNKTDSAVRITHIPSGIVVQCQNDRSQHKNKAEAMKMLKSRLYAFAEEEKRKKMDQANSQKSSISWGNQIRSYVLDDSRVKDLRTGFESPQPDKVLGGDIKGFLEAYVNLSAER